MAQLPMHDNLLAVYPHIIQRLQSINGVKVVKEAGELAELANGLREKRRIAPLDGAVYVVYGGSKPTTQVGNGRFQTERLFFTFAYCSNYLSGSQSQLYEVGRVLTAIQQSFAGWLPESGLTVSAFERTESPAIEYHDSFALYPIGFAVDVTTYSYH